VATIGDGENDIAMFEQAGLSIAMGNAGPNVRAKADLVTASCNDDGFAKAMERLLGSGAVENTHSRQDRP
jgi:hydroxymethylpyrimidine pyrophosphatase-like HAD family hydrolase